MKKQYLYIVLLSVITLSFGCEKDTPSFEEVVLQEGNNSDKFYAGGWSGEENDQFYQDINHNLSNTPLPDQVDLTPLLPPVASQGGYGTCTAWAVSYYTKTAMDALDGNISTQELRNPIHQHSPKDLFWAIPNNKKGPDCNGTSFENALDVLQSRGVASMQVTPYEEVGDCSDQPFPSWTEDAMKNRIDYYREIPVAIEAIKEKLAEGRPVMWAIHTSEAFINWYSSQPMTADYILDGTNKGGHAMTIVGYDDAKQAFRIVNSWGTDWGDQGFAWVSYPLMVNPAFTKYTFVAYNKYQQDNPGGGGSISGTDLRINVLEDSDLGSEQDPRWRELVFNIKNQGNEDVFAWDGWNNVYVYFNAYNANDLGVILHQHVNDWMGNQGQSGPYTEGIGMWDNYWMNTELEGGSGLAESFTNGNFDALSWYYYTPNLNGEYYLAMITDAFNEVEEGNESNNIFFITGQNGRPIQFINGIGQGFQSGEIEERNSEYDPNAYRPEEIRNFLLHLKKTGQLKQMVADERAKGIKAIQYK